MQNLPQLGRKLEPEHIQFLEAFTKSCRHSIIAMLKQSQSGHPGGSLSALDYLAVLYAFIIGQTGNKPVVSNGHISPGVYSVLAEMGYIPKQEVIDTFRRPGSIYEGHVTRHVPGVWYGTGPLGIGGSAACGFTLAERLKGSDEKVFCVVGDGECEEGQVYEMMNFAHKYKLNNLILFMDYNAVQLTGALEDIMPMDFEEIFHAGKWHVITIDGHDYGQIWEAISEAHEVTDRPVIIIGHTIMGKGVPFMEENGRARHSDWHGNAPKPEQADEVLPALTPSPEEEKLIARFRELIKWRPAAPKHVKNLTKVEIDPGEAKVYGTEEEYDCRTAYGQALLDLAKKNANIVAFSADLMGSVMTKFVAAEIPERHFECGIEEQHMVSCAGGMSFNGFIPFASTFGAFMSSRAKDQARVNDINHSNVKMVATHCGLSVGEDGPTHQAIDDMGSFLGMFNTMVIEPADANQCDRIIRYVASHYGNFYVRMGRHKFPVLTKEDGSVFYGADYEYMYGKCDVIREGSDVTIAASGALVSQAVKAWEVLRDKGVSAEVIAVSSIKRFDDVLMESVRKTGRVVTVEDHNTLSGLGGQMARELVKEGIVVDGFKMLGVTDYQLSGKWNELYKIAGIDAEAIVGACG